MTVEPPGGGRFTARNIGVRNVIFEAYQVGKDQLFGGPAWVVSDRFDILARAEQNASREEIRAMLRTLLADRFKLSVHKEKRNLPIYTLLLDRKDGKLGPQLRPTSDCDQAPNSSQANPSSVSANEPPPCGFLVAMKIRGTTLPQLARYLMPFTDRPVQDRTSLTGRFHVELEWAPAQMGAPNAPQLQDKPSIFVALQEQLGLKLVADRAPFDVLVIDHIDHPTPD